jgi:hypothetical protein
MSCMYNCSVRPTSNTLYVMRLGETISLKINICNFVDCSCVLLMGIANERWRGKCSHINLNDTLRGVAGILAISTFSKFAQRFNPAQGTGNN